MPTVDSLRQAGAKAKSILKYLNTNSNPAPKDVQKLIQTLKKRERGSTSCAHRLKDWMRQFCGESGNVGHIFVQRVLNGKVGVVLHNFATRITLQTKHMLDIYRRFQEVLMIDATHGTNMSKYKIFSFMAHDVFGKGQYVQHAILENERNETLFTAIKELKKQPSMDKAAIADYCFSFWQKSQLRAVVNFLVYARNEREYNKHRRYLKHLTSIGLEREVGEMYVADDPNYHTVLCGVGDTVTDQDLWCSHKRQNAVTLGNNTNNRLESSWKHMKEVVKSSMSLDQCLGTILFYQNQTETLL
ncbi:LOW QUALITY PROTEIN: hypothetical protein PHMEG_00038253 [Phytophthora megakarya]|uniref:ZSWIM1/3 RNaseH-like domain-containing protein n=1 Tax=Phytophthora megakarya TaxID=4795 RepID=A0A225UJD3_9STRA|nr:LOW QUALITY PROTEIN: hypothetical protein PHMEG_00038253 [Phytophthora megakarya]